MIYSAIIPTINRPNDLIMAITSILEQEVLPNELIIVDQSDNNNSYDLVCKLYKEYKRKPKLIYFHDTAISGLIEAKQKAVKGSNCDVICFLEDDVVLNSSYFKNAVKLFEENDNVIGCCGVVSNLKKSFMYEHIFKLFHRGIFYDPRINVGKKDCNLYSGLLLPSRYLSGGISCYRKEVFEKVKFDMVNDFHMLEDIDFSTRAADIFGNEHFFINTSMRLEHHMSAMNRLKLKERWKRKLIEYVTFYKKHSKKKWSLINLIWLLIGMFSEAILSSLFLKNLGPFFGFIIGLSIGIRKKLLYNI
ncbi:glycosyltransferase [Alphaproteobacteria bacterium]|nr:glycosyltransferase [Alphaproteobacteria bacterium]